MTFSARPTPIRRVQAFSIIEIMAVLVIIGLLAGAVAYRFVGSVDKARITRTRLDMSMLEKAILEYDMEKGRLPSARDGFAELDVDSTVDAWGQPYVYQVPGLNGRPYDIISLGADGEPSADDLRLSDFRDAS